MPYYTADQIRQQFVDPLMQVVADLSSSLPGLESLVKDGKIPAGGLPITDRGAIRGIAELRKLKRQLRDKIEGANDGLLMLREKDRLRKKKSRAGVNVGHQIAHQEND